MCITSFGSPAKKKELFAFREALQQQPKAKRDMILLHIFAPGRCEEHTLAISQELQLSSRSQTKSCSGRGAHADISVFTSSDSDNLNPPAKQLMRPTKCKPMPKTNAKPKGVEPAEPLTEFLVQHLSTSESEIADPEPDQVCGQVGSSSESDVQGFQPKAVSTSCSDSEASGDSEAKWQRKPASVIRKQRYPKALNSSSVYGALSMIMATSLPAWPY